MTAEKLDPIINLHHYQTHENIQLNVWDIDAIWVVTEPDSSLHTEVQTRLVGSGLYKVQESPDMILRFMDGVALELRHRIRRTVMPTLGLGW